MVDLTLGLWWFDEQALDGRFRVELMRSVPMNRINLSIRIKGYMKQSEKSNLQRPCGGRKWQQPKTGIHTSGTAVRGVMCGRLACE